MNLWGRYRENTAPSNQLGAFFFRKSGSSPGGVYQSVQCLDVSLTHPSIPSAEAGEQCDTPVNLQVIAIEVGLQQII